MMASYQQFRDWLELVFYPSGKYYPYQMLNAWNQYCKANKINPRIEEPRIK